MKTIRKAAFPLILALIFSLCACGGAPAETDQSAPTRGAPTQSGTDTADAGESDAESASTGESATDNAESDAPDETPISVRIAALKGPTSMGLVKLMSDAENGAVSDDYAFTLAASPDEVSPLLIQGQLDIACIPANLAAVLYNRTGGQIVTLAVNTLGVLYLVERGNAVQSWEDLRGMTVAASGKGSTPEYALRYLLSQNGLDPDADVTIDWKSEHSECVAALASGAATVALLPQPFVTVAQNTVEDLRVALDLTWEWDALNNGSTLITGVAAARKEFVEANPEAAARFLDRYAASVEWVNANVSEAAELIGAADIIPAPIAEKALPHCNIVCVSGDAMEAILPGYLAVLYDAAPESVGGSLPESDFYYHAQS